MIRRFKSPVPDIILKGSTLTAWAKRHHITIATASEQFHFHLEKFTASSIKTFMPAGPYVLLADGLWFTFKKQDWVLFLRALKPISENKAYFLDPILLPGGESYENWSHALAAIPGELRKHIKAFVSDGFRVSKTIVSEHGLIHQRCHFHLIAYLQVRRGHRKKNLKGNSVRESIYQAVIKLLKAQGGKEVKALSNYLRLLARNSDCPNSMRMSVSEFLRALPEFRAYLKYTNLHLPTTTGTVETMCKLIRKNTRTLRTAKSLKLWAAAIVRLKSPLTCNGKDIQHN